MSAMGSEQIFGDSSPTLPANRFPLHLLRQNCAALNFEARGFPGGDAWREAILEDATESFINGFNNVIESADFDELNERLSATDSEYRGFAYEGAGMACAQLDLLTLSRGRRLSELLRGPGVNYIHLIHVGVGWAFARLRLRPWRGLVAGDPLLRWLAWDGWGFYRGYFATRKTVLRKKVEFGLGARRSVRDQGLGRALWFHDAADVTRVGRRLAGFPPSRRPDLWSGVGLAVAYTGAASDDDLRRLTELAGAYRVHMAQGVAFACTAHLRGGGLPEHTRRAAEIIAGAPPETAADWTAAALSDLPHPPGELRAYETWRRRVREAWTDTVGGT